MTYKILKIIVKFSDFMPKLGTKTRLLKNGKNQ